MIKCWGREAQCSFKWGAAGRLVHWTAARKKKCIPVIVNENLLQNNYNQVLEKTQITKIQIQINTNTYIHKEKFLPTMYFRTISNPFFIVCFRISNFKIHKYEQFKMQISKYKSKYQQSTYEILTFWLNIFVFGLTRRNPKLLYKQNIDWKTHSSLLDLNIEIMILS